MIASTTQVKELALGIALAAAIAGLGMTQASGNEYQNTARARHEYRPAIHHHYYHHYAYAHARQPVYYAPQPVYYAPRPSPGINLFIPLGHR